MKKLSPELIITLFVILVVFGYFQGVVVPQVAQNQGAAVSQFSSKKAALQPCNPVTQKCGKVIIIKDTVPDAYQDFLFQSNIPGYTNFLLDDDSTLPAPSLLSNTRTLSTPDVGSFNVWESTLGGGYNTTLSCSDPTNNTTTAGMTTYISMNGGETITCTFTNTKTNVNPTVPPVASCGAPNTWTQKADFGGGARIGAVGFSIGGKGYMGTGAFLGVLSPDFWEYDPSTNTWTGKANFGGGQRANSGSFSIANKGYIGAGNGPGGSMMDDFWEYNPVTNIWTQRANFGGGPRGYVIGISIGNKGYMGVGIGPGSGPGGSMDDFWEYNPVTNIWTQRASFGGGFRFGVAGSSVSGKGYIGTGAVPGSPIQNDFWEYCP